MITLWMGIKLLCNFRLMAKLMCTLGYLHQTVRLECTDCEPSQLVAVQRYAPSL